MRKIDMQIGSVVAGAAAGVTLSPIIERLAPGTVPFVDTILPGNWSKNEVFYPLVIGGVSVGAGILLDKEYSNFLLGLGSTAIVSSILKAVLTPSVPAAGRGMAMSPAMRAQRARLVAQRAQQQRAPGVSVQESKVGNASGQQLTPTGVPLTQILY